MPGDVHEPIDVERGTGALPSELVLGLHWDPASGGSKDEQVDLDVVCMLFTGDGTLETTIDPENPRGVGGAVVHTGDSKTGASPWDDERVFVFLDALPQSIERIAFLVCSVTGQPFHQIAGARCHLSDRQTEVAWLRVDLTAHVGKTEHMVACLERSPLGWRLTEPDPDLRSLRACT